MHKFLITGVLGAFTALAAPTASADPGQGRGQGQGHVPGSGLCKMLECTDAQLTAVTKIKQEQRAEVEEARKALDELRTKLAAEFAKPTLDAGVVDQIQAQMNALHADMANARLDGMKDLHAVLTPAQRTKIAEKMKHHGFGHHRGAKAWKGKGQGKHKRPAPAPQGQSN